MSSPAPENTLKGKNRPFNGKEYIESLQDEREIYIYGERVKDVTKHPAFRNSVQSIARLYDALHSSESKEILTCDTDTGSGGYTHRFFRYATNSDDLFAQRSAMAEWAKMSYGWMGRTPDYKASFTNTLGANPDFYGQFSENAKSWYKRTQEAVPFINHALVNPPIDRDKIADDVKDVYISIDKETDSGIYVSGAKVVATSSALTHYNFLGQNMAAEINDDSMAIMFIADMRSPGIKLICRPSYELQAAAGEINCKLGVKIHTSSKLLEVDSEKNTVILDSPEGTTNLGYDVIIFATDPKTALNMMDSNKLSKMQTEKKYIGSSGKLNVV